MTENFVEPEDEGEQDAEVEPTLEVRLADADELMYEDLVMEFSEEFITADVREVVKERVRQLYDNRDAVAQEIQQAQQQAALGGQ